MADQVGKLLISAGLVFSDHVCHGQTGNASDQQHIQQPVIRLRFGNRIEPAAVPATVGNTDERLISAVLHAVNINQIMPIDALDKIDTGGQNIRSGAGHQRQTLISADRRADTGVKADRADVQRIMLLLAADQVKRGNLTVEQPV